MNEFRAMICAFGRDCDVGGVGLVMQLESIEWFPVDHKATATGWEAGIALYKESRRLQQTQASTSVVAATTCMAVVTGTHPLPTYMQDASERCSALAKLVQAYVACPSAAESMFEASPPWQLLAYEADSSSADACLLQSLEYVSAKSPCMLAIPSNKMCSMTCASSAFSYPGLRLSGIYVPTCWCDAGSVLDF